MDFEKHVRRVVQDLPVDGEFETMLDHFFFTDVISSLTLFTRFSMNTISFKLFRGKTFLKSDLKIDLDEESPSYLKCF